MKSFFYRSSLCTLPFLFLVSLGIVAGGCPLTTPGETETTTETSSTTGETTGMTTATVTSTTTVASTTATTTSSTDTTPTSMSDPATTDPSDTSTETTDGPPCDKNLICEGMEDVSGCLHDCGECDGDGVCDPATETPYWCPSDCAETTCNGDAKVDALHEQCDDGNESDDDGCTNECKVNVCGDGHLHEGMEECDDGNLDDADGCLSDCTVERRLIFVSSGTINGNLMGLTGADSFCEKYAPMNAGAFMAWVSDGNVGPSTRFGYDASFAGHFVLSDGTVVARGWSDLLDGDLEHAIDLDEGMSTVTPPLVWTNTGTDGSPKGTAHCKGWSSALTADKGHYGATDLPDSTWTDIEPQSCASLAHVYCVQVTAAP